jgi:hypothetical protein
MINKISDHVTVERLVNRHTLFGDDGESHACHHHRVTILRALRERLTGRDLKIPQDLRNAEDARALKDHRLDMLAVMAHDKAELGWMLFRFDQRHEDQSWWRQWWSGQTVPRSASDEELVHRVTSQRRCRRESAATLLQGRKLSPRAARALVYQLGHHKPAYREAARVALTEKHHHRPRRRPRAGRTAGAPQTGVARGRPPGAANSEDQHQRCQGQGIRGFSSATESGQV